MLICPTCGGAFEARKYLWKPGAKTAALIGNTVGHPGHVYICSTRRRKPGVCTNTFALPTAEADDVMLSAIEGCVLNPNFIDELLHLIERVPDNVNLEGERDRFRLKSTGSSRQSRLAFLARLSACCLPAASPMDGMDPGLPQPRRACARSRYGTAVVMALTVPLASFRRRRFSIWCR
jgi:hypothetical protein